jgi:putative phage-type endonuclease
MPREIACTQGTPEWFKARAGIPTASEFHKIVTPATGKYSAQARGYQFRLLAEKLLGEMPADLGGVPAIQHGKALEETAVNAYEFESKTTTRKVGFVVTDDGRIGASPDRVLVEGSGWAEIKCPLSAAVHLGYWADGFGADYHCQRQGQMFVADLDFVDMFSYFRRLPSVNIRYGRDEDFLSKLKECLKRFYDEMSFLELRLLETGFFDEAVYHEESFEELEARLMKQHERIDAG